MNEGISIDEACRMDVIGTKEDYEKNCNPDGSVKQSSDTTTISLRDTDISFTVQNSHLYVGLAVVLVVAILITYAGIKKFKSKRAQ